MNMYLTHILVFFIKEYKCFVNRVSLNETSREQI